MAGRPVTPELAQRIREVYARTQSTKQTAKECGVGKDTVVKYRDAETSQPIQTTPIAIPEPSPIAGGATLPDPVELSYEPFRIDTAGTWLIIGDTHLPFHDKRTIELAVEEARRRNVVGVLLNGDILDCAEVSEHDRDPDSLDLVTEIEIGKQFMRWLRSRLPSSRIVYKEGNHDNRVPRYILKHAPALFAVAGVGLQTWLELPNHGVEWVQDKRVVRLGKLNVVHGHEYRGGGGVMPARWLYLKARSVALCGHFHRTSEHHARSISDHYEAAWSVGCACFLAPAWMPLNDWNHGFAFAMIESDGTFAVENKRVLNGKIV